MRAGLDTLPTNKLAGRMATIKNATAGKIINNSSTRNCSLFISKLPIQMDEKTTVIRQARSINGLMRYRYQPLNFPRQAPTKQKSDRIRLSTPNATLSANWSPCNLFPAQITRNKPRPRVTKKPSNQKTRTNGGTGRPIILPLSVRVSFFFCWAFLACISAACLDCAVLPYVLYA